MPNLTPGQSVRVRIFGGVRDASLVSYTETTIRVRFGTRDGRSTERTLTRSKLVEERRPRRTVHTKRDVIDELEERAIARDRAERRAARPHPKPSKPARSGTYLEFIRPLPCCGCHRPGPSDPHHWGKRGIGQKASDFSTVPLCRECHDQFHTKGTVVDLDRKQTTLLFLKTQVALLQRWAEGRR